MGPGDIPREICDCFSWRQLHPCRHRPHHRCSAILCTGCGDLDSCTCTPPAPPEPEQDGGSCSPRHAGMHFACVPAHLWSVRCQSLLEQGLDRARSECVDGDGSSPLAGLLDKYALSPGPRDVRYVLSVLHGAMALGESASIGVQLGLRAAALRVAYAILDPDLGPCVSGATRGLVPVEVHRIRRFYALIDVVQDLANEELVALGGPSLAEFSSEFLQVALAYVAEQAISCVHLLADVPGRIVDHLVTNIVENHANTARVVLDYPGGLLLNVGRTAAGSTTNAHGKRPLSDTAPGVADDAGERAGACATAHVAHPEGFGNARGKRPLGGRPLSDAAAGVAGSPGKVEAAYAAVVAAVCARKPEGDFQVAATALIHALQPNATPRYATFHVVRAVIDRLHCGAQHTPTAGTLSELGTSKSSFRTWRRTLAPFLQPK